MFCNVPRPGLPGSRHGLLRDDSLLADGAAIIKASKLAEAMSVNGVTTWQILRRLAGGKHVFATYRTVVLVLVLETVVSVEDVDADTHAALSAVPEGFYTTDSTETAFIAMKGFLGSCHPKVANTAMVFPKNCITADAQVGRCLTSITFLANNFSNSESVHG